MKNLDQDILKPIEHDAVSRDEAAKWLKISCATANGHLLNLVGDFA